MLRTGFAHAKLHGPDHADGGPDEITSPLDLGALAPLADGLSTVESENLMHSNDTERSTAAAFPTKIKEIKLNSPLNACRVKFDLKTSGTMYEVYAQIFRNGTVVGTYRSTTSETYVTFSEDFTGWIKDDLIQIYAWAFPDGTAAYVRNMRIYYDIITAKTAPTNQDP